MVYLNLSIRIEELSPFARWLYALLKQYQQQFSDYSPDFAETFTTILEGKIKTVDDLVLSELFIGELSKATQKLTNNIAVTLAQTFKRSFIEQMKKFC